MAWDPMYINYAKVEVSKDKEKVKVWKDQHNYAVIDVSNTVGTRVIVSNSEWQSDLVHVTLNDGKIKAYSDTTTFTDVTNSTVTPGG